MAEHGGKAPRPKTGGEKKSGGGFWGFLGDVLSNVSLNVGTSRNPTDPHERMDPVHAERKEAYEETIYRKTEGAQGTAPAVRVDRDRQSIARSLDIRGGAAPGARVPQSGGAPLSKDVRAKMEPHLGNDLSGVRVHTSGESAAAAQGLSAKAFTLGSDVHFGSGQYQPGTKEGDKLLAHELTHVVQGERSGIQRKAEASQDAETAGAEEADVSHPGEPAEQEADAVADKVGDALHAPASDGAAAAPAHGEAKPPSIGAKPAPAVGRKISRKKDDKPPQGDKATGAKSQGAKPGQTAAPAAAGEKGKGRGLDVFPVAKSTVEGVIEELGHELVMNFKARTVDGASVDLGHGAVAVDEQSQPRDYPHFTLDATYARDGKQYAVHIFDQVVPGPAAQPGDKPVPVGKGTRTPTTQFAIEKFLAFYQRRFGHEPEKLYGYLAWSNKLNFQREYYKLVSTGTPKDKAKEAAVAKISFGKHRIAVGYGQFKVEATGNDQIDLGTDPETGKVLGKQMVPNKIEVWASRSKK